MIGTYNADGEYLIGNDQTGSYAIGEDQQGTYLIGYQNTGYTSIGTENTNTDPVNDGPIGVGNTGTFLVGQDLTGDTLIGFSSSGNSSIGTNTTGSLLIGFTVGGNSSTGFNVSGTLVQGADSEGENVTGFYNDGTNLIGTGLTGSDIIANSVNFTDPTVPEWTPVSFDYPTGTSTTGSTYNSPPSPEQASSEGAFITQITAEYPVNVEAPQSALLSVVDMGCAGDIISVYDWGQLVYTTPPPPATTTLNCTQLSLSDPDAALANYAYSRGFFTLTPGLHILTFGSQNGTVLGFRVDYIIPGEACNGCPGAVPFLHPASRTPLMPPPAPWALPLKPSVVPGVPPVKPVVPVTPPIKPDCNCDRVNASLPVGTIVGGTGARPPIGTVLSTSSSSNSTSIVDDSNVSSTSNTNSTNTNKRQSKKTKVLKAGRFFVPVGRKVSYYTADALCRRFQNARLAHLDSADQPGLQGVPQSTPLWVATDFRGDRRDGACLSLSRQRITAQPDCKQPQRVLCELMTH